MPHRNRSILALASVSILTIALAACGSSNNSSDSSSAAATNAASGGTVSVQSVSGVGDVLVDSQGNTLYTNDQDSGSKVACSGQCTSIWPPLAAPSSGKPTSNDSSVQPMLGVVHMPEGSSQVTFDGKPLYMFVQDSAGQATGDGVTDSFGGTSFTWTAASPGGGTGGSTTGATSSSGTSSGSSGSPSGGGGSGY